LKQQIKKDSVVTEIQLQARQKKYFNFRNEHEQNPDLNPKHTQTNTNKTQTQQPQTN